MQRKSFYKSIILGLLAALSLELAYMKSEENKIKSSIVQVEERINLEKKKKQREFSRDAGSFLKGLSEVQELQERERQIENDEKIIRKIFDYFEIQKRLVEGRTIKSEELFYAYENKIYDACNDLVRTSEKFRKLTRNEYNSFLDRWKVMRGIKNGVFEDIFPGSEDRQMIVSDKKGMPGYTLFSAIEEARYELTENIKLLSDEGKKRIKKG